MLCSVSCSLQEKQSFLPLAFWLDSHAMSGEVQKHLRARKKNKPKNLHKQSPVAVYKSLWTPTKEISSNLLGRDTALSTKDPEQRQIIFCWLKWSSLPLKGRPRTFFFPFHSLLSNASYTSLRISGLYYKHTAISFKRNRGAVFFL